MATVASVVAQPLLRTPWPLLLIAGSAAGWWLTARSSRGMMTVTLGLGAFGLAWLAMMAAMMLPAVTPVVQLYRRAADRGSVAATPVFLTGYLVVWAAVGLPAYAISRATSAAVTDGRPWVARLAGGTLLLAAAYQVSPLKQACLRHCRSPLSFFLARRGSLRPPVAALRAGLTHGVYCLGCCWALMAVLVVLGGMQLWWAVSLAVAVTAEKLLPRQALVSGFLVATAAVLGVVLLVAPPVLFHLVAA